MFCGREREYAAVGFSAACHRMLLLCAFYLQLQPGPAQPDRPWLDGGYCTHQGWWRYGTPVVRGEARGELLLPMLWSDAWQHDAQQAVDIPQWQMRMLGPKP
jgi:hypothetical protein